MWSTALSALLIGYLPGALAFRFPGARRHLREALPAEERLFWSVVLSLAFSSAVALGLATAGVYRLEYLLWMNGGLSVLILGLGRADLRLTAAAPRPSWSAVLPMALIGLSCWVVFYVPPSEYVIGGKDPGTYFNEGIQIAQRGTLTITDPFVASLPVDSRDLYFPEVGDDTYYGSRFMGFYLVDPGEGSVIGQFPHLYPVWVAIGYGVNGLTGARYAVGFLAILGVVAVYFCGAWLVGRPAALAGAALLAVNVIQVWYSRYPNAEILMQLLVFAGILAFSRARVHDDWFFSSVAALLLTLAFFTHLTGILAIGAVGAAALLGWFDRRAPPLAFLLPVTAGAALAALYFLTVLAPYIEAPIRFFRGRPHLIFWAAGLVTVLGILWTQRQRLALTGIRVWLPRVTAVVVLVLAGYAYLFREPVGRLALHDAHALRDFVQFYLTPVGLVAALAGLVLLLTKAFWPASGFVLTLLVFSCVFFYKIRVIPEHFWAARRFLSVILPASCLLIGAAAFPSSMVRLPTMLERRWARGVAYALGVGLVVVIGHRYFQATRPILTHVEYAGVIPQLETLNTQLQDTDLILVESRQASDVHTLALPLAYIYGRRVLIFSLANPDKTMLSEFLSWARGRHGRVLFLGGGGSQLLSRSTTATRLSAERFDIPEYESSYQAYPREVRLKRYDLALYELLPRLTPPQGFELDIGVEDELFLRRFFPQEVLGERGATFRWTADTVFVSLIGIDPEHRTLTLWLNNGGRPTNLSPPTVVVTLDEVELGTVTVTSSFEPYQFEIPLDLATRLQTSEEAGQLQLVTPTWNPGDVLGVDDPRDLGVMVDRITVGP